MSFQKNLINHIRHVGHIPLSEYMGRCNEHYYNSRDPLGRAGDFTTAPEISQMFGELIGAWLVDNLGQLGAFEKVTILECGPGRGTLMADILRTISKISPFISKIEIVLLECSSVLKAVQRDVLSGYNIRWIKDIHSLMHQKSQDPIFIIGNEFLDALPIEQYVYQQGEWKQRHIAFSEGDGGLIQVLENASFTPPIAQPEDGAVFEASPVIEDFCMSFASIVQERGYGAVLLIDYGHTKTACGDTFQALKDHKFISPYVAPGDSDLTAHVNFECVGDALKKGGLNTFPPVTQRRFLNNLGLQQRAAILYKASHDIAIEEAVRRLSHPDEMGHLFKVITATTPHFKPVGFL